MNRLANATSPYLLQHAHNPVDWYEWGDEALERARAESKPIMLSIGYAACHWCHVMERESFEDAETAQLMNEWFVSIKVDREERPDLDQIYMDAVQAMTGHGGWPMTVFLTPDGKPFYGGTYFPDEDRHGMPSFTRVLTAVHDAWESTREDVLQQADALVQHIDRAVTPHEREHDLHVVTLDAAMDKLRETFDAEWGGFGGAPKFPQPMLLDFMLRMNARGAGDALSIARATLARMARGGMFDQAGGGFHRYSVDRAWMVPHFEKMLYDNGQLLRLYTRAWIVTRDDAHERTAIATADWLLREMRHESGGFYSSLDADSEGVEGKFYVWNLQELRDACGTADADVAAAYWSVTPAGNWEGTNVLWTPREDDEVAKQLEMPVEEMLAIVERCRSVLLEVRSRRVRPATDDKVLAAWNGLAISGLAEAGRTFDRDDYVEAATRAGDFVLREMRDPSGRLQRSWRDGRTSGPGFLDDHALMTAALLDLYETTFDERWFAEARRLCDDAIRLFSDNDAGGFFDTGSDAGSLVLRPKELFDNAVPSGNAVMAEVLLRIGALTGETLLEARAERYLKLLQPAMGASPHGFGHLLGVLDLCLAGAKEIAVAGDPGSGNTRALARVAWERVPPNHVLAVGRPGPTIVPLLAQRTETDGKPTAYVCERFVCLRPVTTPEMLDELLRT